VRSQGYSCFFGDPVNGRFGCIGRIQNHVDFALTQLSDDAGLQPSHIPGGVFDGMCHLHQQVNITTLGVVIRARAEQFDFSVCAEDGGNGGFDGLYGVGGQAHGGKLGYLFCVCVLIQPSW